MGIPVTRRCEISNDGSCINELARRLVEQSDDVRGRERDGARREEVEHLGGVERAVEVCVAVRLSSNQ